MYEKRHHKYHLSIEQGTLGVPDDDQYHVLVNGKAHTFNPSTLITQRSPTKNSGKSCGLLLATLTRVRCFEESLR